MGCPGELRPDEGDARVAGHSVVSQLSAARQQLGYCPQARSHCSFFLHIKASCV